MLVRSSGRCFSAPSRASLAITNNSAALSTTKNSKPVRQLSFDTNPRRMATVLRTTRERRVRLSSLLAIAEISPITGVQAERLDLLFRCFLDLLADIMRTPSVEISSEVLILQAFP